MARKVDLNCTCPHCGCAVVVHDYKSRYPDRLCICNRRECLEAEDARFARWWAEHREEVMSPPPVITGGIE